MENLILEYSRDLDMELSSLHLIQENKYCGIYRSEVHGQPFIIKKYKGEDSSLIEKEAKALDFYHEIAREDPDLIDSRATKLNADRNILCIGFVEGECFSDLLYQAKRDVQKQEQCVKIMAILGRLMNGLYGMTHTPGEETSPFIFEYLEYSSGRLEDTVFPWGWLFKGMRSSAKILAESLRESHIAPSFIHGDFVFRNMHVQEKRIGLIDFANTIQRSHVLNDVYNLRMALHNMILPGDFKMELWSSFARGLNSLSFPETAHRFYYEYHRRRWLMLKIKSRNPKDKMQAVRGLLGFARAFRPEFIAL
jgi:hypothetical protein